MSRAAPSRETDASGDERHIGMCRNCRTYVRQVKATTKALGKLPPPELPPELEAELLRRFETWKSTR
jgi:hypothetical protein